MDGNGTGLEFYQLGCNGYKTPFLRKIVRYGRIHSMEMAELLRVFDRTAANLKKLEGVWSRAKSFMPDGPAAGTDPEYEDLRRSWMDLLEGLPPIEGWRIEDGLPDIDELGQDFLGWAEAGEFPWPVWAAIEKPGNDLAEYRYKFNKARRVAVRDRLQQLIMLIDSDLPILLDNVERTSSEVLAGDVRDRLVEAFSEVERLMGDSSRQSDRWNALYRHLHFGHGQDWHDIRELDWPSAKSDVIAAGRNDADPLPVPDIDLGYSAAKKLTGTATSALPWDLLSDEGFERLLFDLLQSLDGHQNVQWLQRTRAADRGRDLSCERVIEDGAGGIRTERVIVQAKHWQTKSVGLQEISSNVEYMRLIPPPVVRVLVFATSGAFTLDAIEWSERRNEEGNAPYIELWPHSRLESMLANHPELAASHGLR